MELVIQRLGAAHDVPLDVSAAAERGQQGVVDGADRFLDIALEHAMKLKVLARRNPQRAVGPSPADLVVCDVCVRRHDASRNSRPDHQLVVLVQASGTSFLTAIAIILLIDSVELEQLLGVVTKRGRVLDKLLFDQATKVVARRLDGLVLGQAFERCAVGQIGQLNAPPLMWDTERFEIERRLAAPRAGPKGPRSGRSVSYRSSW